MTLRKTGVQMIAEGGPEYLATIAAAGKATLALGTATDAAGRQAAAYAQRIDHLNTTIGLQKRQLGILEQQLQETAKAHGADSIQAQKQQLAVDRLSAAITNNQRTADRLTAELGALGRAEDSAAQKSTKLGEVMTGALRRAGEMAVNAMADVARAIGRGIADAVSMAGDYEQAMNVLQAQSGATAEQMARIGATAKALGADLSLPATSAVDAGKAMLELSKGGLSVEESMAAAKGTLQLAAAAETDVATAANITTGALQAFGLAGTDAVYVADLMANAANQSRASITDLAQGFQQAGFMFHATGQSAADLAAALAILSNVGLTGSDAGTALKNAMTRLVNPTKEAAGLMRELGINVYSAQGDMLPMRDIIGVLDHAFAGMTQQQRNAALSTILLGDGMKAMIPLLEGNAKAGLTAVEAFDQMKDKVNVAGSAADLAAAQMKGMKGAVAGLSSQIETLALEALEPLLPILTEVLKGVAEFAGGFVGKVGPAVKDTIAFVGGLVSALSTGLVPTLVAVSAAAGVFAVINLPALIVSLAATATSVGALIMAFGPFALAALAIAGVIIKANELQAAIAHVTDKILAGSKEWQASIAAMDAYNASSEFVKTQLAGQATALQTLQTDQRAAIETLTAHTAAYAEFGWQSGQTAASLEAEKAAINERGAAIVAGTGALNGMIEGYQHLHDTDALENMRLLRDAHYELGTGIYQNAIDYEALAKAITAATTAGTTAVAAYVTAATGFEAELTATVLKANADQAAAVASGNAEQIASVQAANREQLAAVISNYAEQALAARASLGEQLIAFTRAYGEMNGIATEKTEAVVQQIEKTYGVAETISSTTMEKLKSDIAGAMSDAGGSVSGLGGKLNDTTEDAVELKEKMDALKGQYEAELVQNFKDGKIDADELRRAINDIPRRVNIEIHTNYTSSGGGGAGAGGGGQGATPGFSARASGGPVDTGTPYIVGEHGPELFVPDDSGDILNTGDTRQMLRPAPAGAPGGGIAGMFKADATKAVQGFVDGLHEGQRAVAQAAGDLVGAAASGIEQGGTTVTSAVKGIAKQVEEAVGGAGGRSRRSGDNHQAMESLISEAGSNWPGRASGGPVRAGQGYTVGERGPELFSPGMGGTIVPPATAGQILAGGASTTNITNSRTYNYAPTYAQTPRAPSVDFATLQAWSS